jgi:hypothetical protein
MEPLLRGSRREYSQGASPKPGDAAAIDRRLLTEPRGRARWATLGYKQEAPDGATLRACFATLGYKQEAPDGATLRACFATLGYNQEAPDGATGGLLSVLGVRQRF